LRTSARTTSNSAGSADALQQYTIASALRRNAEQCAAAATVLGCALDQAGDLDELHEHAADPRQGGDRAQGGERVVAGLDLDLGQRLQQRRLADIRRSDEADLGRPLAADGDRIAVDRIRANARLLDLREQ
jgi:hypothetical protein